jgi:hypothetical protein
MVNLSLSFPYPLCQSYTINFYGQQLHTILFQNMVNLDNQEEFGRNRYQRRTNNEFFGMPFGLDSQGGFVIIAVLEFIVAAGKKSAKKNVSAVESQKTQRSRFSQADVHQERAQNSGSPPGQGAKTARSLGESQKIKWETGYRPPVG